MKPLQPKGRGAQHPAEARLRGRSHGRYGVAKARPTPLTPAASGGASGRRRVKIYTKKGDAGRTRLFDGTPVPKNHFRLEAVGDVDELNAVLGAARAFLREKRLDPVLAAIQSDLFAVGAQLADPKYDPARRKAKTRITEDAVRGLELVIDAEEAGLKPLKRFVLPAGTSGAALLHLARTVCRRAERRMVALAERASVAPILLKYANRLSDLLFVLARAENARGGEQETDW